MANEFSSALLISGFVIQFGIGTDGVENCLLCQYIALVVHPCYPPLPGLDEVVALGHGSPGVGYRC